MSSAISNAIDYAKFRSHSHNGVISPRCASAIQMVRPLESTAETQPKLQPALLRLSAIISQDFTRDLVNVAQRYLGEEFLRIHCGVYLLAFFGAKEATICSKRGSPRSGSQKGISLSTP